jgi:hypothetical protein
MKGDDVFGVVVVAALVVGGAVGGAAMVYTGVRDVDIQHRAQTTWRPVKGRVLTTTVQQGQRFRGKAAILNLIYQEYRVHITYNYTVDGVTHAGHHVAPPEADSDRGRRGYAEQVAARFPPGQPCEVFYDTADPVQSYLLRGTTSNAYGRILIGLFLVILCGLLIPVAMVLSLAAKRGLLPRPLGLAPTEQNGWSEVLSPTGDGLRGALSVLLPLTLLWVGGVGATCWHFFAEGVRPLRWGALDLTLLVLAGLIALVLLLAACGSIARARRRRRALCPPRVYLRAEQLVPGTTVGVCAEQVLREAARVKEFTATLVNPANDDKQVFVKLEDRELNADEPLVGAGDLVLGPTAAPAVMHVVVTTVLADNTRGDTVFPLWSPAPLSVVAPIKPPDAEPPGTTEGGIAPGAIAGAARDEEG